MPPKIYAIDNYGSPDSGVTYYTFVDPDDNGTNPDMQPVRELDAAETIQNELSYYVRHGKEIAIPHRQLLELMCELKTS